MRSYRVIFWLPRGAQLGGVESWSVKTAEALSRAECPTALASYPSGQRYFSVEEQQHQPQLVPCGDAGWNVINNANLNRIRSLLPAIFIPNYSPEGFAIAAALTMEYPTLVRVVGFCHTDEATYYRLLSRFQTVIHRFIGVSAECGETLRRMLPHRGGEILVRSYGVDVPEQMNRGYSPSGQPLRLLYAGRIDERQKRITDLVRLAQALSEREVDFILRIVGDGVAKPLLLKQLALLPADDQARIFVEPGVLPNVVPDLLRWADVVVQVSAFEGTSLLMLEALAAGCVPVMTRVSGTDAVIREGVNGFTVSVGDMNEMASVLVRLARDRTLLRECGVAAHASAYRHSSTKYHEWFASLLDDVWCEQPRPWPKNAPLFPWHLSALSRTVGRIPGVKKLWRSIRKLTLR